MKGASIHVCEIAYMNCLQPNVTYVGTKCGKRSVIDVDGICLVEGTCTKVAPLRTIPTNHLWISTHVTLRDPYLMARVAVDRSRSVLSVATPSVAIPVDVFPTYEGTHLLQYRARV